MRATLLVARASAIGLACALVPATRAHADPIGGDIPVDTFRPALDARGFITVDGGEALEPGKPSFGLVTSWARGLLLDGSARVDDLVSPTLVAAIGLPGPVRAELAASLPFAVIAASTGNTQGVGDLDVHAKVQVLDRPRWAIAVAVGLGLPTATHDRWMGSGAVDAGARAIVEWRAGRLRLAGNLGGEVSTGGYTVYTDPMTGATLSLGPSLRAGAAASWALSPGRLDAIGELGGQLPLGDGDLRPVEATVALRVRLAVASHFTIGAGTGLGDGAGNPTLRAFAAIVFEPRDGRVTHTVVPEAPPPPEAPVVGDRDGDHIPDNLDKCPDDPEDFDGYQDDDGCPDLDNDGDHIPDSADLCPDDPEDFDGIQDDDGCPETDADNDRIPDVDDHCPLQPESWNDYQDDDGCPDRGEVQVTDGTIDVFEEIHFEFDSAVIQARSHHILDVIAKTMKLNPDVKRVEVGGHTDARGAADYNLDLSQRRADAVRDYLIGDGVDPDRLTAVGYGETRPKVHGTGERAWKQNRRVEFVILERRGDDATPR